MAGSQFQFVTRVVAAGNASQDDALVAHRDGIDIVAVVDGAGNSTQSHKAARHVLNAIESLSIVALTSADEALLVRLLGNADREISHLQCGETTAVVCILRGDEIIGASVGDSGAWIITHSDFIDLSAHQRRKPLLGSGEAIAIPFRRTWTSGHLLVASDGLLKYTQPHLIFDIVRAGGAFELLDLRLLDLVRMRSDGFQDDVAIAICTRASVGQTTGRRELNKWIYDLIYCGDCLSWVPEFRDLAPPEQQLIEEWTQARPHYLEIAAATGLTDIEAKAWCIHQKKPLTRKGKCNSQPCPKCGRWLRTPQAKQCFHCGADWH